MLLLACAALPAQNATGKISGVVTDPTGAVVVGAKVTVTNSGTKVSRQTATDKEGQYQVLQLPIGRYDITAEAPGFSRTVVQGKNSLEINQSLRVDVSIEVGSVKDTITIEGATGGVETENATVGATVIGNAIHELPLNGRNAFDLLATQPGVTPTNPDNNQSQGAGYSIGGGRTDSVTFLLDGGNNNNLLSNTYVVNPNPDAIAEFKILESNYSAEYGRNAGGIVSVVTKSGTNSAHGSAYDYIRNDALNANDFFSNAIGAPRNVLKRHQFGVTLGGPVFVPKVFDGRNKLFFFFSYQGQRQSSIAQDGNIPVMTPLEAGGNFSKSNSGAPDPLVVSYLRANPYFQSNPTLAAQGIIDPSKINNVSANYVSKGLFPVSPAGVVLSTAGAKSNNDEFLGRMDYNISNSDSLNVTLTSRNSTQVIPFSDPLGGANVPGFPNNQLNAGYFGTVTYNHIFKPTLINEARMTAQRGNLGQWFPGANLPNGSQLGATGVTPDQATGPVLLNLFGHGTNIGYSPNGPTTLINNTFQYSDNLSWTKGSHSLKFGFYFSPYQNNTLYDYFVNGAFFFYGQGGIGSGNDFADFMMGLPDEFLQFGSAPSNIRSKSYAFYGQDEWRLSKRLTLNYGLRWEYASPKIDTQGRSFSFMPGLQSTRFTNAPLGLVFPGDKGAPNGANFPNRTNFAPRLGIAWDVFGDGKTAVRAGGGMFYDILKGEDNLQFNGQVPFFSYADLFLNPADPQSGPGGNYMADPFTATGSVNPFPSHPPAKNVDFASSGFLPVGGGGVYYVDPHLKTPYVFQYNFSIQQRLPGGLVGEAGYVGSSAHGLTALVDVDPYVPGTNHRIYNTDQSNPIYSYMEEFMNVANSNYNSLQTNLTKRFADSSFGGTFFTLSYTWSHEIDNSSGFRQTRSSIVPYFNHGMFRASGDFDVRHSLSFSGGWDLPFDKMWAKGPKVLTKGWSLYPILTYRTGFPLDVFAGLSTSNANPGPAGDGQAALVRADLVGNTITTLNPRNYTTINGTGGNYWFSPNNFSNARLLALNAIAKSDPAGLAGIASYGSLPRNALRGPGMINTDLSIAKHLFVFREKLDAELRADAFNVFNHTNFANPTTNINSPTFGTISSVVGASDPNNPRGPRIIQVALHLKF